MKQRGAVKSPRGKNNGNYYSFSHAEVLFYLNPLIPVLIQQTMLREMKTGGASSWLMKWTQTLEQLAGVKEGAEQEWRMEIGQEFRTRSSRRTWALYFTPSPHPHCPGSSETLARKIPGGRCNQGNVEETMPSVTSDYLWVRGYAFCCECLLCSYILSILTQVFLVTFSYK